MLAVLIQRRAARHSALSALLQFGVGGLFIISILDSLPFPTFSGPDILVIILAANHRNVWYEYPAIATAGSVLGAYFTYRLARKAGQAYIDRKFKGGKVKTVLKLYKRWAGGALFASCAIPVPFPTGVLFAASGVSNYPLHKFLGITVVGRGIRYTGVALIAELYGRHIIRVFTHPGRYWIWLVLMAVIVAGGATALILVNRRMAKSNGQMKSQPAA